MAATAVEGSVASATTPTAAAPNSFSAAARYAGANIRFNVLAPALVATPMSQRAQGDEEILQFIRAKQPLDGGRIGQPGDLDAAAVYFLSDDSKFATGQVLAVDGGWCVSEGQVPSRGAAEAQAKGESVFGKLGRLFGKLTGG